MTDFCHITPTAYLDLFAAGRTHHLVLAHLVEEDEQYANWYANTPRCYGSRVIMDNSAFEMFKQGKPMYESSKLLDMGRKVNADYIVMSDYPGEPSGKTIEAAKELAPIFHYAGFGTFFVPQAEVGDVEGVIDSFMWAATSDAVDYIGVSILTAPNMFGVEKGNNLQRFLSRWKLCQLLEERNFFGEAYDHGKKIHFLGMVDGPNEVSLVAPWLHFIDTWDSSAAVWAAMCGIEFDNSPTGLINGKNEIEVDFDHKGADNKLLGVAAHNIRYIDMLLEGTNDDYRI
jgi:hypothetical protein